MSTHQIEELFRGFPPKLRRRNSFFLKIEWRFDSRLGPNPWTMACDICDPFSVHFSIVWETRK